jgi:hypothetical protein
MKNNKTIFSILLLLPLLTGCGVVTPIKHATPDEYYERKSTIESIYPSTKEDVIRQLEEPEWIKKKGGYTYFIYQSESTEYGVGIMLLPIIPYRDTDVFCLFLEFDEANHLVMHISKGPLDGDVYDDCINYFNPLNPDQYARHLWRGADKGDAEKQFKLYWQLPTGPENTRWVCRAADQGHPAAQSRLGFLYSYGSEGLPKDTAKALMWYQLSASNGSQDASSEITRIQQTLTADQYTRSQELLRDWQPGLCELDIIPYNTGR